MSDVSVGHEMVLSSSEEIPPQEMCSVYITCILYRGPEPVLGRNKAARSS